MVLASHFVIKGLAQMLARKDLEAAEETFWKFTRRYEGDEELQKICDEFEYYLKSRDAEVLKQVKKELNELVYQRKLEVLVKDMRSRGRRDGVIMLT